MTKPTTFLLLAILLASSLDGTIASTPSSRRSNKKVQPAKKRPASTSTTQKTGNKQLLPPPSGKACSFYIWDVPAATIYRLCRLLQKDCTYEGRGGRKFIYIQPGSLLQLLHPLCPRSKDPCLICGGTYRDHMVLAWAKNLYRPFDLHMDRTFKEGYRVITETTKEKRNRKQLHQPVMTHTRIQLAFHERYVKDVTERLKTVTSKKEQNQMMEEFIDGTSLDAMEMKTVLPAKKSYIVPASLEPATLNNKLFRILRTSALERINTLIFFEFLEEHELNMRRRPKKFI
jgi:hypothetical protein